MSPSAETDIVPLDSLWGSSDKMTWEILPGGTGAAFPEWLFVCSALALLLIFSRRFSPLFSNIITNFPKPLPQSRALSFPTALAFLLAAVLCSALTSGFICYLSIIPFSDFRACTIFILSALAAKAVLLVLISEVSGQTCFSSFIRAFLTLLTGICFITLTVSLITWLLPEADGLSIYTLIILISLTILVYLYKISLTLFSAGISPFYSFLYLCTVEVIPICLTASLISRL